MGGMQKDIVIEYTQVEKKQMRILLQLQHGNQSTN